MNWVSLSMPNILVENGRLRVWLKIRSVLGLLNESRFQYGWVVSMIAVSWSTATADSLVLQVLLLTEWVTVPRTRPGKPMDELLSSRIVNVMLVVVKSETFQVRRDQPLRPL